MANEYSDLVKEKAQEQQEGANKYADTLRDMTDMKAQQVQSSVFLAQPANPDRQAEVMKLANKVGLDPGLVERNFDSLKQEHAVAENDYQQLIRSNPKLSTWMSNLDNAKLAKDDINGLKNLEDKVKDTSFGGEVFGALAHGTLNMVSGLVKSVGLFADSNTRGGPLGKEFDPNDVYGSLNIDVDAFENKTRTTVDSGLYDNAFTRYLDQAAKDFQPVAMGADAIQEVMEGNISKASRALTLQIISNLPQLGIIAATRGYGLGVLGASSAGNKYAENMQKGIDPNTARLNAYVTSGIETGIEMVSGIGGSGFKNSIKEIVKNVGPDSALNVTKQAVRHILHTGNEEGMEEFVTSIAQDFVDYSMDVNPDALNGMFTKALNSYAVGFGSGTTTTALATGPQAAMEAYRGRTNNANDIAIYNQVGEAAKSTKLNERMPEKQKEFLQQTVEGTPIQELYMDLEGFETYFQKKGMSGVQGATELGLQEQFNQAKEAGTDIKINYADWVGNAVNTEHYAGLQNDIKFSADGSTKNQLASQEQQARTDLEEVNAETMGTTEKRVPVAKLDITTVDTEALPELIGTQQRAKAFVDMQTKKIEAGNLTPEQTKTITDDIARVQAVAPTLVDAPSESEIKNRRSKALTEARNSIQQDLVSVGVDPREARIQSMVLGEGIGALADAAGLTPQQIREQFPINIIEGEQTIPGALNQEGVKYKITENEDELNLESEVARGTIEIRDIETVETLDPEMTEFLSGFERPAYVAHVEAQKGYGSKALRALESAAKRRGADVVYLNASPLEGGRGLSRSDASKKLNEFYISNGYKIAVDQGGNAMMYKPLVDTLNQQGDDTQGQIFFKPRNGSFDSIIALFKSKNQSTFAHESAHYLFNVMSNLAAREESSQRLKDDHKSLLDFVGVESTADLKEVHQEKIARAWEQYLMEGNAPTKKLTRAFANFKTWLTSIYKSVQGLENASGQSLGLTDEVRSVFDRMLMSQEQIDLAEQRLNYNPLFSLAGVSTSATEGQKSLAQKYIDAIADARVSADNELRTELMETERRKKTQYYKDERASVEKTVTDQINNEPVYVAHSIITEGVMPDGSPLPEGTDQMKIDRASFADTYGEEVAKMFPRKMFDSEQGVPVEIVSEAYGFESTADFVDQFSNFIPKKENINATVNAEMEARHPDMMADPMISEKAIRAAHNENRDKIYRMELDYLQESAPAVYRDMIKRITRNAPSDAVMKSQANEIINTQKVSEIRPSLYERAEARYNKLSGELFVKGDVAGSLEAKRKAALNNYLYKAATEARDSVEKDVQNFKKIFKKDSDLAKSRDVDYVNAARSVLAQFGITRADKTADEYLQAVAKYDPDTYQNMKVLVDSATADAVHYKEASYGQFAEMSNAVKALWDLSKSTREIELDGVKMDLETSKQSLIQTIQERNQQKKSFKYEGSMTGMEKFSGWLAGWKASTRVVEHWAIEMGGEFKKIVFDPIQIAATNYRLEKNDKVKAYLDTFKTLDAKSLNGPEIKASELGSGVSFKNKSEVLGALLHTGNESNLRKLLVGRGYGDINADNQLDSSRWDAFKNRLIKDGVLTKQDFQWAQSVWDLNETMKAGAWKAHKKMYGFYPNEVTANEFSVQMADGEVLTFRGGYVPAIADPTRTEAAQTRQEREQLEMNAQNSFMFPTTGRGFTKSRAENYAVPLSIDINQVAGHIDKVLRFTHIEPNVKFVNRIVSDDAFREQLATVDTAAGRSMLVPWLQRSASQRMTTPFGTDSAWNGVDRVVSLIRARTGLQIMGGNVINALQNYTGLSVAMVLVQPKHMRNALWDYTRNSTVITESIVEKSDFMKVLLQGNTNELLTEVGNIIAMPTAKEKVGQWLNKNAYVLQKISQDQVSAITWQAAYDQSIERGMSDVQSVQEADSIVRQTQANLTPEGSSRFMAGPPVLQLFTQFFGYFNNLANLNETQFKKIMRDSGLRKGAGKLFALYMLGTWMPAVLSDVIRRAASGVGFDENDDDQYMDDFISMFLGAPSSFLSAQVPFVGQATNLVINRFNDKRYDDRLNLSPAISTIESMAQLPGDVYAAINNKKSERQGIRNAMNVLGVMSGLPGGAAARPLMYLNDIRNGDATPKGPVDFIRGAVTGKAGKKD